LKGSKFLSNSNLILLLQIIHVSGEVNSLLHRGLQFSQIAQLISIAEGEGYIVEEGHSMRLTEKGLDKMRTDTVTNTSRADGGWISPLDEYRIEKLAIDKVYLPSLRTAILISRQGH
jgi:hypothetical protein